MGVSWVTGVTLVAVESHVSPKSRDLIKAISKNVRSGSSSTMALVIVLTIKFNKSPLNEFRWPVAQFLLFLGITTITLLNVERGIKRDTVGSVCGS